MAKRSKEDKATSHEQFLEELSALSKKYGLKIRGCGCCGSPSLSEMTNPEIQRGGYVCDDDGDCVKYV